MLPDSTIRLINDQIQEELRHLNSIFCDTQEDKMDTLERINKLRSMLVVDSPNDLPKTETQQETLIDLTPLVDRVVNRFKKH